MDMPLHKAIDLIRGPKGSRVKLTVIPANATSDSVRKTVVLVRDEIKLEEAALEELKVRQAAHLQEVEDLQKQRRETETESAEMEDGIKKSRARLMEIKSNIEYIAGFL